MSDENHPEDPLLARLQALPPRRNEHDPAPKAREAFEHAFVPWPKRLFASANMSTSTSAASHEVQPDGSLVRGVARPDGSLLVRGVVPVLLAGVVAIYLLWAFSAALALQG